MIYLNKNQSIKQEYQKEKVKNYINFRMENLKLSSLMNR
jgi:hypothetical protein